MNPFNARKIKLNPTKIKNGILFICHKKKRENL